MLVELIRSSPSILTGQGHNRNFSCGLFIINGGNLALSLGHYLRLFVSDGSIPSRPVLCDVNSRRRCWLYDSAIESRD